MAMAISRLIVARRRARGGGGSRHRAAGVRGRQRAARSRSPWRSRLLAVASTHRIARELRRCLPHCRVESLRSALPGRPER